MTSIHRCGRALLGRIFFLLDRPARIVAALAAVAAVFHAGDVRGAGVLVSPTQLGLVAKAGQTVSGPVYVQSSKAEENRVAVTIADFTRSEDGALIEVPRLASHARSCASWLSVDRAAFISPQKGRVELTVSAAIPANAKGSYWAVLYIQAEPPARDPKNPGLYFRIVPRVAIPVIVTVEGSAPPALKVLETRALKNAAGGVDVQMTVENTGESAVLVSGAFTLERHTQGAAEVEELATAEVGPLTSLPGLKTKAKVHLKYDGALAGLQAHAYVRWGSRPEDAAEAATTIEDPVPAKSPARTATPADSATGKKPGS